MSLRAPAFWHGDADTLAARLLAPAAAIVARITALRVARRGWRAGVPVICCGNASVGGAGKTPLVLEIAARLGARGVAVHCLARGHGGRARGVLRVDPAQHGAADVGDEPLLLARRAPTWIGRDRAAAARAAIGAGAQALVLDDGLQNPGLAKTLSLLVVDGGAGFGNGRVLPAGPLREPVRTAAARCRAAVRIGADRAGAAAALGNLPVLQAEAVPGPEVRAFAGRNAWAFAGIGRPEKFFAMLRQAGVVLTEARAFPDHHDFAPAELAALAAGNAPLLCTEKDHVRLAAAWRDRVTPIAMHLRFADPASLDALLDEALSCAG